MDTRNITVRKQKKLSRCSSNESLLSEYSLDMVRSLPDLSTKHNDDNEELLLQIEHLKTQLESAHAEIDKISLEKEALYEQILQQRIKIDRYKQMYVDSMSTPKSTKQSTTSKRKIQFNKMKQVSPNSYNVSMNLIGDKLTQDGADSTIIIDRNNKSMLDGANKVVKNLEFKKYALDGAIETCEITNSFMKSKRNLFIIGGQQCVNLASELVLLRKNTKYENYNICGYTKPYAKTKDILKECYTLNITEMDRIVICVGENDTNPLILQNELCAVLKYLHRTPIILLGVKSSKHLNENKLNNTLKLLSQNLKNCSFLSLNYNSISQNTFTFLNYMCKTLSLFIDFKDYESKYLNYNSGYKIKKSTDKCQTNYKVTEHNYEKKYKKGTIPYFFEKIKMSQLKANKFINGNVKLDKHKKGTIPFYFKQNQCTRQSSASQSFYPKYRKLITP